MARHYHHHEHDHDTSSPVTPTARGNRSRSEDEEPGTNDERHALSRWHEEEHQYYQRPPREESQPQPHPQTQIPRELYDGTGPIIYGWSLRRVERACIVSAARGFFVVNCDPGGPQINVCWRVPGPRNIWLARLPLFGGESFGELGDLLRPEAPSGDARCSILASPSCEMIASGAWSMIVSVAPDEELQAIESGEGRFIIGNPLSYESLASFGRVVGFEVVHAGGALL
ncbi:hypothetical protein FBEOM_5873 [Fusarium beomiforme]|uniref:Uncharacterized protein n=1 Tax=Fusarium beomiforme TaxID=44412 RepID=A0A9P5AK21_9HYPO|nr:hypothetical protein FBEOM_5873 [Fusarium beomiforme]